MAEDREEKCVVFEGQTAEEVAVSFAEQYDLAPEARDTICEALRRELSKLYYHQPLDT